jgi:hypothetical protein
MEVEVMTDITMHLTMNFYPPIPHDIQLRVQEIFDEIVQDGMPYITGWADVPEDWCYEYEDWSVLDREYDLPNGARITVRNMLEELRLWDAIFWDCEEPMDTLADYERDQKEYAGQLSFWEAE